MKSKPKKTDHCLNCQQPLQDENFCPNCGQKNDGRRLTLSYVLSESVTNLFAFDGRFFRTLHTLFRFPGKVPREYIEGKRAKYMNPVRIYFLSSILLLSVIQISEGSLNLAQINREENDEATALADSLEETVADSLTTEEVTEHNAATDSSGMADKIEAMTDFYEGNKDLSVEQALDSLHLKNNLYHRFLYAQSVKIIEFDQDEFNEYLFSKLFWVLFLFLPILALLLKLLYVRRPFYYPEHLFFTFYLQSVFFILMAFVMPWEVNDTLMVIVAVIFAAYLFMAMKKFYRQGTGKTLLKFILLNLLIIPSFVIFLLFSTLIVFILF